MSNVVKRIKNKLKTGHTFIRMAPGSSAGWKTVQEYQSNDIADNSDDEKKIDLCKTLLVTIFCETKVLVLLLKSEQIFFTFCTLY